ncbi:MAG: sulfite exporter TauE/SafE family protein [Candidatus Eremiobacteraeota bacterium]|nr:sulfite exporter TauE/SafE family protein [Candidatus Eremiobacteraeota bacterium]
MPFDPSIGIYVLIGLCAQLVDGTLGMGYGVLTNSVLMSMGLSPAVSSASVHLSEIFTTGLSGFFHTRFGNVEKGLFRKLVVPGVIGGAVGAYLLTSIDGRFIRPFISCYLCIMGIIIIVKTLREREQQKTEKHLIPLGLAGGFFDALGGGGWGPIVTSTLIAKGNAPRFTIGSVNTAEFFVTLAQSLVFIVTIGSVPWKIVIGLLCGGAIAAPWGAWLCRKLPHKPFSYAVGILIIALSARTLLLAFLNR